MLFDFIVIFVLLISIYLGYRFGSSIELYRLAKIFIGLSLASTYSGDFGRTLTEMGLLKANDWAVLTLTGFLALFMIYWLLAYLVERLFLAQNLHKSKLNAYLGMILSGFQGFLVITFVSFMSTQLSFVGKEYKTKLIEDSFFYIHMDRFCREMVTAKAVDDFISENRSSAKGMLNTLSDAAIIKEITK